MAAGKMDIDIEQGATFSQVVTINDSLGAPIDLTGATFSGNVRAAYASVTPLASFEYVLATPQTGATKGKVTISISAANTALIPVKGSLYSSVRKVATYLYDIKMTQGLVVTRVLEGAARVSPEASQSPAQVLANNEAIV